MDKPIYTDCLKYIRESVVYDINNILTPIKPKKTFFESYSDMCNYRAKNWDDESDLFSINNFWGSYTQMCKKRSKNDREF